MHILILGDGNFSFSLSLAEQISNGMTCSSNPVIQEYLNISHEDNIKITATSFDSKFEVLSKYRDSVGILERLEKCFYFVSVIHGVNAWELKSHFELEKFDFIIWNHPHLGTEDFRLHQFLMAHFFHSCTQVLNYESNPQATVRLSLVQGQETRWAVIKQASKVNLGLQTISLFNELDWPGYVVKRNKHGGSFKNLHTKRHVRTVMKSCVYSFTIGTGNKELIDNVHAHLSVLFGSEKFDDVFTTKPALNVLAPSLDLTPPKRNPNPCKKDKRPPPPPDLVCVHCSKQMATPRGYNQHVHTVHTLQKFGSDWQPDRQPSLPCSVEGCLKKFVDKEAISQHVINKHTSITSTELPSVAQPSSDAPEYEYIACLVCGQSCINQSWGLSLHLESLKPAVGMDMKCPLCVGGRGFIEQRALVQHYKFCRSKTRSDLGLDLEKMKLED